MVDMSKKARFLVDSIWYSEREKRYLFIGTEKSLKELSEALDGLRMLSNGAMIEIPIAPKEKWDDHVSLAFAKCSTEKFEEIHANRTKVGPLARMVEKIAGPSLVLLVFAIMTIGVIGALNYAVTFILWIIGNF